MAGRKRNDNSCLTKAITISLCLFALPFMVTYFAIKTRSRNWIIASIWIWLLCLMYWTLPGDAPAVPAFLLSTLLTALGYLIYSLVLIQKKQRKKSLPEAYYHRSNQIGPVSQILPIEQTQPRPTPANSKPSIEITQPRKTDQALSQLSKDEILRAISASLEVSIVDGSDRYRRSRSGTPRPNKGQSLLDFPPSYVVIDVETTGFNPNSDKIIEIGALRVVDGEVVDRFIHLINPGRKIPSAITELTGISDVMVKNAPSIGEVLPDLKSFIGSDILVGHNVNFDVNFLYEAFMENLNVPVTNDFVDTLRFARQIYPQLPNHKLATLLKHLGIIDKTEHRSYSDSLYTNQLFQIMRTQVVDNGIEISNLAESVKPVCAKDIIPSHNHFDPAHPVFKKVFAYCGLLNRMTIRQAMQTVADLGGRNSETMTKKVRYLVIGDNVPNDFPEDGKPYKVYRYEILKSQGVNISMIRSDEFYSLINV